MRNRRVALSALAVGGVLATATHYLCAGGNHSAVEGSSARAGARSVVQPAGSFDATVERDRRGQHASSRRLAALRLQSDERLLRDATARDGGEVAKTPGGCNGSSCADALAFEVQEIVDGCAEAFDTPTEGLSLETLLVFSSEVGVVAASPRVLASDTDAVEAGSLEECIIESMKAVRIPTEEDELQQVLRIAMGGEPDLQPGDGVSDAERRAVEAVLAGRAGETDSDAAPTQMLLFGPAGPKNEAASAIE